MAGNGEPVPGKGLGEVGTGASSVESPALTEEQQKIDTLVNQVRGVNLQLGGELAREFQLSDGRTALYFTKGRYSDLFFGVDSRLGATSLSVTGAEASRTIRAFLRDRNSALDSQAIEIIEARSQAINSEEGMEGWHQSFEASKQAALSDKENMERVRAERGKNLDQALAVVSEPINIDAPSSSGTATESLATPPPTAFK